MNDLLADGSEIEILTLAGIIVRRLNELGVTNIAVEDGIYSTLSESFCFGK